MWPLIFAGVSAASGLFSAIDSTTKLRAIKDKLDEIARYLDRLQAQLEYIEKQNVQILDELNALPKVISAIVLKIVAEALLDEKYASLYNIKLNIIKLNRGGDYRIKEQGWQTLSESLTYLFLYENRFEKILHLILYCEMALAVTRNEAQPFIKQLLDEKIDLVDALRANYLNDITSDLNGLKVKLDNAEYILSHNLNDGMSDFSALVYTAQPDRLRTIHYSDRVCKRHVDLCGESWEVCQDIPRTRDELDLPFQSARNNHCGSIEVLRNSISFKLLKMAELCDYLRSLTSYANRIDELKAISENVLLFHPSDQQLLGSSGEPFSAVEQMCYHSYFDDISGREKNLDQFVTDDEILGVFDQILRTCPPL